MTRRQALAIARDLRRAERIIDAVHPLPAVDRREAERLVSDALARLINADEPESTNGEPTP